MSNLFAVSLGKTLANLRNLNYAQFPVGIDADFLTEVVRSANAQMPSVPPFAILVTDGKSDVSDPLCHAVSINAAIMYREGDKLAVTTLKPASIASIRTTFQPAFGPDFPEASSFMQLNLEMLSESLASEILSDVPAASVAECERVSRTLANCLRYSAEALKGSGQESKGTWNAIWYKHASISIDNLRRAITYTFEANDSQDSELVTEEIVFASFGLPKPLSGGAYKTKRVENLASAFESAISTYWFDEELIASSLEALGARSAEKLGLLDVTWGGFNESRIHTDSPFLSWNKQILDGTSHDDLWISRLSSLVQIDEEMYFNPYGETSQDRLELPILNHEGQKMILDGTNANQYIVPISGTIDQESKLVCFSEEIQVHIPTSSKIDPQDLVGSRLALKVSDKSVDFKGTLTLESDGVLVLRGKFSVTITGAKYKRNFGASVKLSLAIPAGESLLSKIETRASSEVYLLPSWGNNLAVFKISNSGRLTAGKFFGISAPNQSPESITQCIFPKSDEALILTHGATASVSGQDLGSLGYDPNLKFLKTPTSSSIQVLLDPAIFSFEADGTSIDAHSPLIAAIDKVPLTSNPPEPEALESLRGKLEQALAEQLSTIDEGSFHAVLVSGTNYPLTALRTDLQSGVLTTPDTRNALAAVSDFEVPLELLESAEYAAFRDAIKDIDFYSHLVNRGGSGFDQPDLISRTSWKFLWEDSRVKLENYLLAYENLVDFARRLANPYGIFWAAYQLSASIWSPDGNCEAVLLSPLHPVRLAWLSTAESCLFASASAKYLAGTVEGWNLPLLGPSTSLNGRMIAVPTDNGKGQLFIGWSMLAAASVTGHEVVKTPAHAAALAAPGAAASGMNSAAAQASLRNYRQINPHLQAISIDLASVGESQRLTEIDQTVLDVIKTWSKDLDAPLPGGVRIYDSTNRLSSPPLGDLSQLAVESGHSFPVTWQRYLPDKQKVSNLRLLQDSGVRVTITESGTSNLGVVGDVPLRRFDATTTQSSFNESVSSPSLPPESGWFPFAAALNAIEKSESKPEIRAKLFGANLISDKADWTISGETLISPSGIASLLNPTGTNNQMLWEWRPPIFDSKFGDSTLEKRPFVSIARIPLSFKSKLQALLSKAKNASATQTDVESLLSELGTRGVGLSSLLSMGSTHAVGAVGFYLTFKLLDLVEHKQGDHFVLPIDACNTFLNALIDLPNVDSSTSRADLLVLSLTDNHLYITPVEIKLYGLTSTNASGVLPGANSNLLEEAKQQLQMSREIAKSLEIKAQSLDKTKRTGEAALWFNALSTLLEAASRLSRQPVADVEIFRARLQRLTQGDITLKAGKGLVNYLVCDAETADGAKAAHFPLDADTLAYTANTESVFCTVGEEPVESSALQIWRDAATALFSDVWQQDTQIADSDAEVTLGSPGDGSSDEDDGPEIEEVGGSAPPGSDYPEPSQSTQTRDLPPETQPSDPSEQSAQSNAINPLAVFPASDGVRFQVGHYSGLRGPVAADLWLGNTELTHMNMGVVGNMGTGKTQLLKSLVYSIKERSAATQINPLSFLIFDYKEDYQAGEFIDLVGGEVLSPSKIPINFFQLNEPYSKALAYQKSQSFISVLKKIYSGIGPVQEAGLSDVILKLFARAGNPAPTMKEVHDDYLQVVGQADSVIGILRKFVLPEIFTEDKSELKSFRDLITGKSVVVALNKLGIDDQTKNALVVLFLDMYYEYMLNSPKHPFVGKSPSIRKLNSFLLVDEATNIMAHEFPVLKNVLLQGREFGFGVILASQYLSHFKTSKEKYSEALLTWFINAVPAVTKAELANAGIKDPTDEMASKILGQKVHEGMYSSFGHKNVFISEYPFFKLVAELQPPASI